MDRLLHSKTKLLVFGQLRLLFKCPNDKFGRRDGLRCEGGRGRGREGSWETLITYATFIQANAHALSVSFTSTRFRPLLGIMLHSVITVKLKWLEHHWDHEKMFETGVLRANEC